MKVQTLLLTPEKMARELATSREIATRESADRSNQYIVENDFRLFSSGVANNYVSLPNLSSYFNTLPLLIEFFWCRYSHAKESKILQSYAAGGGFQIYDYGVSLVYFLYSSPPSYCTLGLQYGIFHNCHYVSILQTLTNMRVYIDGVYAVKGSWVGTPKVSEMTGNYQLFQAGGAAHLVKQEISHFSIWNPTDITNIPSEILARYNNFQDGIFLNGDETDLKGYWKMNEGVGTTVVDSTINGNNGTIIGCEWRQYGGLREAA